MRWLQSLREKILGGSPTGPLTTDEQASVDERTSDLSQEDAEPPNDPDRLKT
jgi:hypothetical protein